MTDVPRPPRSLRRRVWDAATMPVTMFMAKHHRGGLSMFRVILGAFAFAFVTHWPAEWSEYDVLALGLILGALPAHDLAGKVPVAEWLDALQATAKGLAAKAAERVGGGA